MARKVKSAAAEATRAVKAALFANSLPRVASYVPLAKAIDDAGHKAVLFHPPHVRIAAEEMKGFEGVETRAVSWDDVPSLKGFDVSFCHEGGVHLVPPGVVSVAIFHSLPDRDLLKTSYFHWLKSRSESVRAFDYMVTPVVQAPGAWTVEAYAPFVTGAFTAEEVADRGAAFGVIPGGYPKVEYLDRQLAVEGERDTVIYCPTETTNSKSLVVEHGPRILRRLHRTMPEHRIVFRPYPTDKADRINAVLEQVSDLDRLVVDRSVTGMEHQRRAQFVVTDRSSAAITFALCSGRPAIFMEGQGDGSITPSILGYEVAGVSGLGDAVRRAIEEQDLWPERIRQARIEHLYRPFDPCAYLASNLERIAARGSHEDWLSIPRF